MVALLKLIPPSQLATQSKPIEWLWDGVLAKGMVTLMTSRWKEGKTTLMSALLAHLGRGETMAGSPVAPTRTVILSEEPKELWELRHKRLNFDEANIRFACRPFERRLRPNEWSDVILELADENPGLVVLDPLAMFLPGNIENQPTRMLDAVEQLHVLTEQGTALGMLHHPSKRGSRHYISPRGTGALAGFADILVELDCPNGLEDRVRRLRSVSRLASSTTRFIELTEDHCDYTLVPELPNSDRFEVGWPVLKSMLEDAYRPPSRKELLKTWLEDFDKPSKNTLIRWLDRAEKEKRIEVLGTGRQHDAFRYLLKGQEHKRDLPDPNRFLDDLEHKLEELEEIHVPEEQRPRGNEKVVTEVQAIEDCVADVQTMANEIAKAFHLSNRTPMTPEQARDLVGKFMQANKVSAHEIDSRQMMVVLARILGGIREREAAANPPAGGTADGER
jgi:hypothetical protein